MFKKIKQNKTYAILLLCILLVFSSFAGILFGSVSISPAEVVRVLTLKDRYTTAYTLIMTVRIPRVFGGIFAGMGLSCAGVILQSVMNNSLASPNTIGVNSGSGFAVMLTMMLLPANSHIIPFSAFCGALITTLLIFLLAYLSDSSRTTIILAGITISSFFNAGINAIKLLDSEISINLTSFMIGSLSSLTKNKLILPCVFIFGAFWISLILAKSLNILSLGDDIAGSLGMQVSRTRFIFLCLASIMAGCVVSYAGLLSFVGLIVPHICRQLFGNDARFLLPCSALLGGSFVLLCDLLGRVLFAPFELPVGILMAFIGGPFFLYLLLKKKGGRRIHA